MKDGTEHTFRNVTPDDWKEPVFYNEYEILYISYTDEKGKISGSAGRCEGD